MTESIAERLKAIGEIEDTIKQMQKRIDKYELEAEIGRRLLAALQQIADMRYDNTSTAAIARRALENKP